MSRRVSALVRIPVWNGSGVTLRFVGFSDILLPVHCVHGWCVACQHVRRINLLLLRGGWEMAFWGHAGDSLGLVYMEGFSPHVYKTQVTKVCQSLDTSFGGRSAEALSA